MTNFTGKVALVTGGTRGIGKAVADRLDAGFAQVIRWGRNVDVTDQFAVNAAVENIIASIGRIDILINNAGMFGPVKSALAYTRDEWNDVLAVNLTGQFLVARSVVPHMVKNGYGRVVGLSSAVGKDVNPMAPAYSVAKAGIIALTKCLGRELAKTGVVVNCVTPAAADTDLFKNTPPEQVQIMLKKTPMERFITLDEIASLVCWLASEECSGSTGATFDISGGRCQF